MKSTYKIVGTWMDEGMKFHLFAVLGAHLLLFVVISRLFTLVVHFSPDTFNCMNVDVD